MTAVRWTSSYVTTTQRTIAQEPLRCASSHLMTGLLTWRNPQGNEEGWIASRQGIENGWKHFGKVVSTEIGLAILTVTSVIETVAYTALTLASLTLYPITDKPCKFFTKLMESSSFTIIWGLVDGLYYNLFFINVLTRESFARLWAEKFNKTPIVLFRLEDRLQTAEWERQLIPRHVDQVNDGMHVNHDNDLMLLPIIVAGRTTQNAIDQGADFIKKDILAGASKETVNLFKEMDPLIFMFILTKAVFIYTVGAKKKDAIPDFFKPTTKSLILASRQKLKNEKKLQQLFADPTQFEKGPQGNAAKSAFDTLRSIASGELQDSLLATRCCQKAVELLDGQ